MHERVFFFTTVIKVFINSGKLSLVQKSKVFDVSLDSLQ